VGILQLIRVARLKGRLEQRSRWTRAALLEYQARQFEALRRHAYSQSPFYREFHRGHTDRPLEELPVLTKSTLMERFDDLVTDRSILLRSVEEHLARSGPNDLYLNRYRVNATSGSSGQRGFFVFDRDEWTTLLASYLRPSWWAGAAPSLTRRWKMARFTSQVPWHATMQIAESLKSRMVSVLALDPTRPIEPMVSQLNEWQPNVVGGYPSVVRALAELQLAGRLRIWPAIVATGGEVVTPQVRSRIEAAWGSVLFDYYGATETGVMAVECREHAGMHVLEDLTILENVDSRGRPVPPDEVGERVLATVLFRRTQPLIRYEITDCVRTSNRICSCGRPFRLIESVAGRQEESLQLPGVSREAVRIDSLVFESVLDTIPASQWQVVQLPTGIHILMAGLPHDFDERRVIDPLHRELRARGAAPLEIKLVRATEIPRGATGKAVLVRRTEGATSPAVAVPS